MNDKDLNCIDLVRAVTRISRLCSIRATKGCKNCIFRDNSEHHHCAINYPTEWNTRNLYKWIKEHESEGTKKRGKENSLNEVREANRTLQKIKDICNKHKSGCITCPLYAPSDLFTERCKLRQGIPEHWEIEESEETK